MGPSNSRLRRRAGWGLAATTSLTLACLNGMSTPAAAHRYGEYTPFWDLGSDWGIPRSHHARQRGNSAKASEQTKSEAPKQPTGPLILAVSIGSQKVTVYDNGTPIAVSPISSGMAGHPTPTGVFSVIQKQRWHRSNLYSNAPMPYMQRITWSGVALHAGVVPGYPASHGCIRLPERFAVRLWGMTKVGARVVVTRDDAAPYEISHPRLAGLVKSPDPEADGAATPNTIANSDKSDGITGAVMVASTDASAHGTGEPDSSGQSPSASPASASPQLDPVGTVDTPVETGPAAAPSATEPAPGPKAADPSLHAGPVSLFVSRKAGKLFVRKGFAPVFETPVTIAHPEMPLGTHVFTAYRPADDSERIHWLAVSIGVDRSAGPATGKRKGHAAREERPTPATAGALRQAAADALDRIELPPEALERIAPLVGPGASLLLSDHGLGEETGRDTDFIVVTK